MGPENSREMDVEERIELQRQHSDLSKKINTAAYYAEHGFSFASLTKPETAEVFTLQTDEDNCPANIMKDAARRIESYYLSRYKAISAQLEKDRQSDD